MRLPFTFSSKLSLIMLLGIAIFLANLRYQQYKTQQAIDKEKQALKERIESLNKKNEDLSGSLAYFSSQDFQQLAARQQLNLKREGEVVFGFADQPAQSAGAEGEHNEKIPNYQKWIKYFFGTESSN